MLTIGICGASGSGKSTLARALQDALEQNSILITQDCYYKDHSDLPFSEREKINYDEPDAFEHGLLLSDFRRLTSGHPITRKGYDYANHCRADSDELIHPTGALIFEGIHAFYDPHLRELMDLKLYISVDPDICLLRRIRRDINKRDRHIDGIAQQYLTTVKPMYDQFIRNYIDHADVIVAGGGKNKKIVDVLAHYINSGMVK